MPPSAATPMPSQSEALWIRLSEIYGGEALKRRYAAAPPSAWREVVDAMPERELQRAMRRLLHGGNPHVPTLPEFLKLAKAVGDDHEPVKPFNALPNPNNPGNWDVWALEGNKHLMGYVTRGYRRFARLAPAEGEFISRTLVAAKNRWVATMRDTVLEDREDGGLGIWNSLMRQAEAEIERWRAARQSVVAP